jgi:hypothetical protein
VLPNASVPAEVIVSGTTVATVVVPRGAAIPNLDAPETGMKDVWDRGGSVMLEPRPNLGTAVKFLVQTVERMTGKRLAVVEEGATVTGLAIHVGHTQRVEQRLGKELRGLDRDGYLLLATPGALLVCGGSDDGTIFGISALLEKYADCRWLFPGPKGEAIPRRAGLVLKDVNWRDEPAYRSRAFGGMENANLYSLLEIQQAHEWRLHNGMNFERYRNLHNLNHLLCTPELAKQHPEFSPLIDGKRKVLAANPGWGWQPCVSAPGCAEEVARQVIAYFDAHPAEESFSIANSDGGGWCECDACQKLDQPDCGFSVGRYSYPGDRSRRMVDFFNRIAARVAEKHPDKILGFLAYNGTIAPPPDVKLHPMLMPTCTSTRDGRYNPDFKLADETIVESWGRIARQVCLYEYFYGVGYAVPRPYNRLLAEALRHGYTHHARAFTSEAYPNWGLDAFRLWITAKLLWDPNLDPDVLLHDYCTHAFGPAAPAMEACFRIAERAWTDPRNPPFKSWFDIGSGDPRQLLPYTPRVVAEIHVNLAAARAAATDDATRARVEFFGQCWDMLGLLTPSFAAAQKLQSGAPMRAVLETLARPRPIGDTMREYVKAHPLDHFQVYPSCRFDTNNPNDYLGILVKGLDVTTHQSAVTARLGKQIAQRILPALQRASATDAESFRQQFREQVAMAVNREMGDAPMDDALAKMRGRVVFWSTKIAIAFRAATPPMIDGKLDDAVWQKAIRNRDFVAYRTGGPTDTKTDFSLGYDDTNLYLAMWCYQDRREVEVKKAATGKNDANLWGDNSVELFFNASESAPSCHFAFNNAGAVFDARADKSSWQCDGLRVAAEVAEDRWTVEAAIPWASLGINPKTDRVVLFNAVRNRNLASGNGAMVQEISNWFFGEGWLKEIQNRGFLLLN